jgi:hypothetical protein
MLLEARLCRTCSDPSDEVNKIEAFEEISDYQGHDDAMWNTSIQRDDNGILSPSFCV